MNGKNEQFIVTRLADLKRLSSALEAEERVYQERIGAIQKEHASRITEMRTDLEKAEKTLRSYLKKNKIDIFPGKTDRVSLSGGVILRQIGKVVSKARHITVEYLRGKGLETGIKVEEKVNWQEIETWSDDQLSQIETDRKPKETFAYELS
jgi:phage host-nuclease inhibitor protein Gam